MPVSVSPRTCWVCRPAPGDAMVLDGRQRLHIGMRNLRQLARQVPRDDWPALVADHVGTIITAIEEPLDLHDFALVRGLLRARVYPAEARTGFFLTCISRRAACAREPPYCSD